MWRGDQLKTFVSGFFIGVFILIMALPTGAAAQEAVLDEIVPNRGLRQPGDVDRTRGPSIMAISGYQRTKSLRWTPSDERAHLPNPDMDLEDIGMALSFLIRG
jgi:hypothetical protein